MAPIAKPMAVGHFRAKPRTQKQYNANSADRHVLAIHVGVCAFLNCRLDFLHTRVAGRLLDNPLCRNDSVQYGKYAGTDREP